MERNAKAEEVARRWVSGPDLDKVWETPAPATLAEDLEHFAGELADPFSSPSPPT
jgi:hypothetical protein